MFATTPRSLQTNHLLPKAQTTNVEKTYLKFKGDYQRYLVELNLGIVGTTPYREVHPTTKPLQLSVLNWNHDIPLDSRCLAISLFSITAKEQTKKSLDVVEDSYRQHLNTAE